MFSKTAKAERANFEKRGTAKQKGAGAAAKKAGRGEEGERERERARQNSGVHRELPFWGSKLAEEKEGACVCVCVIKERKKWKKVQHQQKRRCVFWRFGLVGFFEGGGVRLCFRPQKKGGGGWLVVYSRMMTQSGARCASQIYWRKKEGFWRRRAAPPARCVLRPLFLLRSPSGLFLSPGLNREEVESVETDRRRVDAAVGRVQRPRAAHGLDLRRRAERRVLKAEIRRVGIHRLLHRAAV